MYRLIDLHIYKADFLQKQGVSRTVRTLPLQAHRGMVTDRHGVPLAVSSPMDSLWFHPQEIEPNDPKWQTVATQLSLDLDALKTKLRRYPKRDFVYLKRHVPPLAIAHIQALQLKGLYTLREYHRFYPTGEVTAQLVGQTNVDQEGLEGIELAYDTHLRGHPGRQQILKDGLGYGIEALTEVQAPRSGSDLALSIDMRLQYLAYRELQEAVQKHHAKAGTAVMLDPQTGEVLAMVNYPSFNPNAKDVPFEAKRNRAVTDLLEPGSVLKTFSTISLLNSGQFDATTMVETTPGFMHIGHHQVRDVHNYGHIDLATVLKKSSNVGIAKLTLALPAEHLLKTLSDFGFGQTTDSGFPGESIGRLELPARHHPFMLATLAFGYGMSATPLQVANAYSILAAGGIKRPISLLKQGNTHTHGERIISPKVASALNQMLTAAVSEKGGTGSAAKVPGYVVAGKTGTVRKIGQKGYESRYISLFAGYAPAHTPKIAMVVVIDEPRQGEYYGGQVAAPVFGRVMASALRILNIPAGEEMPPTVILANHP